MQNIVRPLGPIMASCLQKCLPTVVQRSPASKSRFSQPHHILFSICLSELICWRSCSWRPLEGLAMGSKPRLPMERAHLLLCCRGRPFGGSAMAKKSRLSLGRVDMCLCCSWRPFGGDSMGEKPGLPLG